jgi:adenine-specific DNA-methyltransferase
MMVVCTECNSALSGLRELLIPKISIIEQQPFINKVNEILSLKSQDPQADTLVLEQEIDAIVYALYGLTEEEIKVVAGS